MLYVWCYKDKPGPGKLHWDSTNAETWLEANTARRKRAPYREPYGDTKVLAQAEYILANVRHAALFLGPDPGLLVTKEQRQQAIDRLVVELFGEVPNGGPQG